MPEFDVTKLQDKLPDVFSDMILAACKDAEKCLRNPLYRWNPSEWHALKGDGVCEVCFAGATLAGAYKVPRNYVVPTACLVGGVDSRLAKKMYALNSLRLGNVYTAYLYFSGYKEADIDMHRFNFPEQPGHAALIVKLRDLAVKLKAEGY